jgi:hypothetical protein
MFLRPAGVAASAAGAPSARQADYRPGRAAASAGAGAWLGNIAGKGGRE